MSGSCEYSTYHSDIDALLTICCTAFRRIQVGRSLAEYIDHPTLSQSMPEGFICLDAPAWIRLLIGEDLNDFSGAVRLDLERLPLRTYSEIVRLAEVNPVGAREMIQAHLRGSIYMLRL